MMVSTFISETFNLLNSVFWLVVDLSSSIGCSLVTLIVIIVDIITLTWGKITALLQVVYKDSGTFFQDLTDNFSYFIAFVDENITNFWDGTISFSSTVIYAVTSPDFFYGPIDLCRPYLSIWWAFLKVINSLWNGLLLIKSSFWVAVSNIPVEIFYGVMKLITLLLHAVKGILMLFLIASTSILYGVLNIFNFIYNIPYDSVLGIILILLLLSGLIRNYASICLYFFNILTICYQYLSFIFYITWTWIFKKRRNSLQNSNGFNLQNNFIEDRLCVICQDGLKEVIVLPCKHLCLCIHCKVHIMKHHRLCPICRTNIQSLMKVYI